MHVFNYIILKKTNKIQLGGFNNVLHNYVLTKYYFSLNTCKII